MGTLFDEACAPDERLKTLVTHSSAANSGQAWCSDIPPCRHIQWSDVHRWSETFDRWGRSTPLQNPVRV